MRFAMPVRCLSAGVEKADVGLTSLQLRRKVRAAVHSTRMVRREPE